MDWSACIMTSTPPTPIWIWRNPCEHNGAASLSCGAAASLLSALWWRRAQGYITPIGMAYVVSVCDLHHGVVPEHTKHENGRCLELLDMAARIQRGGDTIVRRWVCVALTISLSSLLPDSKPRRMMHAPRYRRRDGHMDGWYRNDALDELAWSLRCIWVVLCYFYHCRRGLMSSSS